jgi:hypothetical protein
MKRVPPEPGDLSELRYVTTQKTIFVLTHGGIASNILVDQGLVWLETRVQAAQNKARRAIRVPSAELTWLTRCWNGGADGSRRSRSVCNANSVRAFQGGWYDCTSIGLIPKGLSWRTGLDATMGMPCMLPYPNFLPSCNSHMKRNLQLSASYLKYQRQRKRPKIEQNSSLFAYMLLWPTSVL